MNGNENTSIIAKTIHRAHPVGIAAAPTQPILDFVVNNNSAYVASGGGTGLRWLKARTIIELFVLVILNIDVGDEVTIVVILLVKLVIIEVMFGI